MRFKKRHLLSAEGSLMSEWVHAIVRRLSNKSHNSNITPVGFLIDIFISGSEIYDRVHFSSYTQSDTGIQRRKKQLKEISDSIPIPTIDFYNSHSQHEVAQQAAYSYRSKRK